MNTLGILLHVFVLAICAVSVLTKEIQFQNNGWERIVGGEEAVPNEFPWMIDIRRFGSHHCGGSIVNEEWIMTAAHCSTLSPSSYEVVAGDHNISYIEGNEQRQNVVRIITHPAYGSGIQFSSDIALFKVDAPFEFNEYVQPAEFPSSSFIPTERGIVAGWGALSEGGSSPVVLMKVEILVVSDENCRESYGESAIADSMLCAGEGGKDSCQGDSGGPLMCERDGIKYVCGIVSWGQGCALPNFPGVYTEVSYFQDWVEEAILPPVDNNDTWIENRNCGGILSGSSGYINYKQGQAYNPGTTCTWTIQASDRENIRLRIRNNGLASDALIFVTGVDYRNAITTDNTRLADLNEYIFPGPLLFLTFVAGSQPGFGFDFEFYGTNYDYSTGKQYSHIHVNSSLGTQSYPAEVGDYYPNYAYSTLVVNPTGELNSRVRAQFNRMDIEDGGCAYDWVRVNSLVNEQFQPVGHKYCGSNPPSTIFESDAGVLIIIFRSDSTEIGTGFTISYSAW